MNNYFHISSQQIETSKASFQILLDAGCDVYRGHFPDHPIAPGACSIEMIRQCASVALGREIRFAAIKQCKFVLLLTPLQHQHLTLQLEWNDLTLNATVLAEGQTAIRFKATIQ